MSLGERIRELRAERGLTQEYLAESLGVTRQAVSRWETDQSMPSTAKLIALTELFGVPLLGEDSDGGAEKRARMARLAKRAALFIALYAALYGLLQLGIGPPRSYDAVEWLNKFLAVPVFCALSLLALSAGWQRTAWAVLIAAAAGCAGTVCWPQGPAGLFSGFIALLAALACGLAAGLALDYRLGRRQVFKHGWRQLTVAFLAAAMAVLVLLGAYSQARLEFIRGADAGYEAGYNAAVSGGSYDGMYNSPYEPASQGDLGWRRYWQNGWHDALE